MDPKSIPNDPMYLFERIQNIAEDKSDTQYLIKNVIIDADDFLNFDDNQRNVLAKVLTKLLSKS